MKHCRRDLLKMGGSPAPPGMRSRPLGRSGVSMNVFSLGGQSAIEQPDNAKDLGTIGMQIPARGRLLGSQGLTMREAMRYVLTLPVSTVIVGCDSTAQLEDNVTIAREFTPCTAEQMAALEKRAEPLHRDALFFRRWEA